MLIKCEECGKEISDKATTCPNCGSPTRVYNNVEQPGKIPEKTKGKLSSKTPFVILMLILFFPVGIYLMWKYKKFSLKGRAIITGLFCLAIIAEINLVANESTTTEQEGKSIETQKTVSNKKSKKAKKTEFQKTTNTTADQEKKILSTLKKCGIEEVGNIKHDEILDDINEDGETGYRIKSSGLNIILYLKKDKNISLVRYADNDLYSKGKVVSTLSDYTFTIDEQTSLQLSCEEAVKSILKSPSTAKFPNINKVGIW